MSHSVTCYGVFQDLLKTLCLKEFPCGFGTWRNPKEKFADGQYSVTMKDYGVQYEKMEVLQEFLNSGTFDVDTSWSLEAANLRNLAVLEPWKLDGTKGVQFIHQFFNSLRIIDKQITEIDSSMLKLTNLESLAVSVNLLKEVPSEHLPPNLKVLELCTNCLQSIASLCKQPPPLLHLGLSHNQMFNPDEYKFLTVEYWPFLMSLDLSYNSLTGLIDLTERLISLPNLKNLILQGNPLSLIPGYRGHVIDAIRQLTIFDDTAVTADEKHHFKGLGKKKELISDEALFTVTIGKLSGVPMPEELKEDEERPEYPIIASQFVVEYEMLEDVAPGTAQTQEPITQDTSRTAPSHGMSYSFEPAEVVFHNAGERDWDESPMKIDHKKLHLVDDLVSLRDFFMKGMRFKILMKSILSWPVTPSEDSPDFAPTDSPLKKTPLDGKESVMKKGKDGKKRKESSKGDKGKKKEGSRQAEAEQLRSDPPIITEIGSYLLPLITFLEGETTIEMLCHCGGGPSPSNPEELELLQKDPQEEQLKADVKPSRGKSEKRNTGSAKSRGKPESAGKRKDQKKLEMIEDDESEPSPPPPILLRVRVDLHKWMTASDSLKQLSF